MDFEGKQEMINKEIIKDNYGYTVINLSMTPIDFKMIKNAIETFISELSPLTVKEEFIKNYQKLLEELKQ